MKKAILLVSHGSRYERTIEEVSSLVDRLREKSAGDIVEYAFLELAHPSIPEGIEDCIKEGATEVVLLLNFLNSGRHVDIDIPAIVEESRSKFPHVKINISKPVGQHNDMLRLFLDLI